MSLYAQVCTKVCVRACVCVCVNEGVWLVPLHPHTYTYTSFFKRPGARPHRVEWVGAVQQRPAVDVQGLNRPEGAGGGGRRLGQQQLVGVVSNKRLAVGVQVVVVVGGVVQAVGDPEALLVGWLGGVVG